MEDIANLPKTKEDAKLLGIKSYFTGVICKNGHIDKRYTNTGICYSCKKEQMKRDRIEHEERTKTIAKRSYHNNMTDEKRGKINLKSRDYRKNNPETRKETTTRNKEKNKEKYAESNKLYMKNKRECPYYNAHKNMCKYIWAYLKGILHKSQYYNSLGYTFDDLKLHLEKQFADEMSWGNYGTYWEIDHKIPVSWYKPENYDSIQNYLIDIWKLENIQPLTCFENNSKHNRFASI